MNRHVDLRTGHSVCPHDCPSTCALDVELVGGSVGKLRGAPGNSYTAGVICAKVARYAERIHHPDRLTRSLRRVGAKGEGRWQEVTLEQALDEVAERFVKAAARHGSETVWPYFYAGTMGLVQRDGIHRLRHAMRYSGQFDTICTNMAWTGYIAGTGKLAGPDPREMALADVVVIWGTNPVSTQINVMTHATRARKERGAKIVCIDVYGTQTMRQADLALRVRPGTDGALAAGVMHVLFAEGYADRAYLNRYTDRPRELEEHLRRCTPDWAAAITGLEPDEIRAFARLVGENKRSYFRLGYGFTRSRNGAFNMHAASCIAAVTGAWAHEGGGAFHNNGAIYGLDTSRITAAELRDPNVRDLDQSRIGAVLAGDPADLKGGPPVTAMLVQNTNPANVAPEQENVLAGLKRDDLYVAVHEQFMTETAALADIVLPATMFLEHDDVYKGGGHQHILFGAKLVEPPEGCATNHQVIRGLAERLGAEHAGFEMSEREHIDWMLRASGWGDLARLEAERWIDCQPPFREAHYLDGFAWPDGKFRFSPDWANVPAPNRPATGPIGAPAAIPPFPDHWPITEDADEAHPYRLVTAPSRSFLNSTFSETPGSRRKQGEPSVMMNPHDAGALRDGQKVALSNHRGRVVLRLRLDESARRGTLVAEGLWPNAAHVGGRGINALTCAEAVAPYGGAAFHDVHVAVEDVSGGQESEAPAASIAGS